MCHDKPLTSLRSWCSNNNSNGEIKKQYTKL